jgi:hypothetical protein
MTFLSGNTIKMYNYDEDVSIVQATYWDNQGNSINDFFDSQILVGLLLATQIIQEK